MKKTLLLLMALSPALFAALPADKGKPAPTGNLLPYHILHPNHLVSQVSEAKDSGKKVMLVLLLNNGNGRNIQAFQNQALIDDLKSDILESKEFTAFVKERDIMIVSLKRKYKVTLTGRHPNVGKLGALMYGSGNRFWKVGTCLVNLNGEILAEALVHTKDLTPKDYIDKYTGLLEQEWGELPTPVIPDTPNPHAPKKLPDVKKESK